MVTPIPPVGATPPTPPTPPSTSAPGAADAGFGEAVQRGLQHVSGLEQQADQLTQRLAAGEDVGVHELMTATSKASIGVEMLTQVRNRAVESYKEIMRLQV